MNEEARQILIKIKKRKREVRYRQLTERTTKKLSKEVIDYCTK